MRPILAQIKNPAIAPKIGDFTDLTIFKAGQYSSGDFIQFFVVIFIRLAFIAGAIVFFFMLLWGSLEYIMAGGEKEKVGNASKRITNALIGLTLILSTFAISWLVKNIFGINLFLFNIPSAS